MMRGGNPWLQRHWDWRAANNFVFGGLGAGLVVSAAYGAPGWLLLAGAAAVGLGLVSVWLEVGRPWRALRVYANPRTSWMSREAIVAPLLFAAVAAAWFDWPAAREVAALLALAYLYCQARMLQAAKGIPAWREPLSVPLLVVSGLAEGAGALLLLTAATRPAPALLWLGFALALIARWLLWGAWRSRIRAAAPALAALDRAGVVFNGCTALALAGALAAPSTALPADLAALVQALCGALAIAGGAWFKRVLVTRGAFNQGFAIAHLPVRGVRRH